MDTIDTIDTVDTVDIVNIPHLALVLAPHGGPPPLLLLRHLPVKLHLPEPHPGSVLHLGWADTDTQWICRARYPTFFKCLCLSTVLSSSSSSSLARFWISILFRFHLRIWTNQR